MNEMTEKIRAILQDPDAVAMIGGALLGLSIGEIATLAKLFEGENGVKLRQWACEERNKPSHWSSSEKKKPSRQGFVYLLLNNRTGNIKIGFSKNPSARERTLQDEQPEVEMIGTCPGTPEKEAELHRLFAKKRIRGEWFALSFSELVRAKTILRILQ